MSVAVTVRGIVDAEDRLIAADPKLEALQSAEGGRLGRRLAVADLRDIVALARRLDMPVTREAQAESDEGLITLWVRAHKDADLVHLDIEDWDEPTAPQSASEVQEAEDDGIDDALRSPVDRIIAAADGIAAEEDGPLKPEYASYGGDIAAAGRHLLSVIRSMNAKMGGEIKERLDLRKLGLEASSLVQSKADAKTVEIACAAGHDEVPVEAEKRAILQILVNILGNAVRHTPEGTRIRINFPHIEGKSAISITDDGPGIPPWDQDRIFESYERAHDADDGGKGLGLSIARRLAREHGGEIELESPPGQGACFRLILPEA
ncbi:sensor histidine kinase [Sphingomicrobium flavum]|uniref:sensor histidine kinase n=1 Tax=Sphingomicrobium flavum TaxID=1229164 RepID=UPI0021ADB4CB|nr:sensor histidine kinase [Sphingomicrobium flavum]